MRGGSAAEDSDGRSQFRCRQVTALTAALFVGDLGPTPVLFFRYVCFSRAGPKGFSFGSTSQSSKALLAWDAHSHFSESRAEQRKLGPAVR